MLIPVSSSYWPQMGPCSRQTRRNAGVTFLLNNAHAMRAFLLAAPTAEIFLPRC
jgi:hypothetical protein